MRENCTPGSVRGAPRKGRSYRDAHKMKGLALPGGMTYYHTGGEK